MKKILLKENSGFFINVSKKTLKESYKIFQEENGKMIVRGVPSTILDEKNMNGRIYSYSEMAKAINECKSSGLFEKKMLTCTADDHPDTSFVKPIDSSHVVIDAYIKEVNGKKVLFNDWLILDTVNGKNLKALLKDGVGVGTSIRGLGVLNESSSQIEEYQYLGTDVVGQPSAGTYVNKEYNIEVVIESVKNDNLNLNMKKNLKIESNSSEEILDVDSNSPEMENGGEVDVASPEAKEPETKDNFEENDSEEISDEEKDSEEKEISEESEEENGSDEEKEDEEGIINIEESEEISKDDSNNEKEKSDNMDISLPEEGEVKVSSNDEVAVGDKPAGEADYEDSAKVENVRKKAQSFLNSKLKKESAEKEKQLEAAKAIIQELTSTLGKLDRKIKFMVGESLTMIESQLKEKQIISSKLESTSKQKEKSKKFLTLSVEALDLISDLYEESIKSSSKPVIESKKYKYSSVMESVVTASKEKRYDSIHNALGWKY